MLEFQGKYGKAVVMIDTIDQETISQIYEFLNCEVFTNYIAIMPDTHAGSGAVIGFTMPMTDKVIPNVVGVDIGCGMLIFKIIKNILGLYSKKEIDERIREYIPFGTSVNILDKIDLRTHPVFWTVANMKLKSFVVKYNSKYGTNYTIEDYNYDWLSNKCDEIEINLDRVLKSLGTLGGGNHFIELDKSENTGDYYFTIHSGSRQFGLKIAKYWQKKAGKGALAYLEGDDMFGYLKDMVFAQHYASVNRTLMMHSINKALDLESSNELIETVHNFIDFNDFIIRKGAIRSYSGEKMIIPFNMEDGILLCEGKSNPDWNFSAPHGAGRVASRSWAKKNISKDKATERMKKKGIYISTLPVDEAKEAYKDPKIIEDAIGPTATIIDRLKPVLVMKDKN